MREAPGLNSLEWDPTEGERPVCTPRAELKSWEASESSCLGVQL